MKRFLLLILLFTLLKSYAQNDSQMSFTEALDIHLPEYYSNIEKAIEDMNKEKISILFQDLVNNKLKGAKMDNFIANDIIPKEVSLDSYEKPVILVTGSNWRLSSKGELPAINDIAEEYGDVVDIILLFWGDLNEARKLEKDYNRNINVLYVDDADNNYSLTIKNLKHSFGLPLIYALTSDKDISNIQKRLYNKMPTSQDTSIKENYKLYKDVITSLLYEEKKIIDDPIVIINNK